VSAYFGRSFSESSINFVARASCSGVTPGTPDTSIGFDGSHGRGQLAVAGRATDEPSAAWVCGCDSSTAGAAAFGSAAAADGSMATDVPSAVCVWGCDSSTTVAPLTVVWVWLWTCVPLLSIAGTVSAVMASAGNSRRGAAEARRPTISAANAQPTDAAPSSAHAVSANCGASRTSRPWIHEMPVTRVASHAPTATPLITSNGTATQRLRRASAMRPAPT
jgi:hypothetical protein